MAIGDLVAARDGFTGAVDWRPVRELFRRTAPSIAHVTLDGPDGRRETLHVTSEHPFFVAGKGWTEVRRLERSDRIISEHEATLAVADVSVVERPTLVYNFEVAQDHNYFVGDEGAEAHNGRNGGYIGKKATALARQLSGGVCLYCLTLFMKGHRDHRIPFSCNGTNDWHNLDEICLPCNLSKGALNMGQFEQKLGRQIVQ
nr:polymorphic toxin-type HINT domain-containing protein [Methylosinus sporium]